MAKKRNYENDEVYKNFRVEDFLPEMKWREPEAKASEPKPEAPTEEVTLFPSLNEPDISPVQAAMPEAARQDEPEIQEDDADDTGEKVEVTVSETDVPVERIIARRISSKQRRLSLEEYRTTYLQVPKITDRKPVFLSGEIRDKLDEIVRRIGGRGLSVSGLVENLARQHLIAYGNDIDQWRKL